MKKCLKCGKNIRKDIITGVCTDCRKVCKCGKPKDRRADECLSCGMSRKAKTQWATNRTSIASGLKQSGIRRRRKYGDLKMSDFSSKKISGRRYAFYWDGNKKRTIYRYQWKWSNVNGPIPKGFVIHHRDLDETNDDMGNLELMTKSVHAKLHNALKNRMEWICQNCKNRFAKPFRRGSQPRKFCSQKCHYAFPGKCETFEPANEYTKNLIE